MNETCRELDDDIYAAILDHCAQGDALSEDGRYEEAIEQYHLAWNLVPHPKVEWEASTWILAALADAHEQAGDRFSAREALDAVMSYRGALGNPYLHFRRGQMLFDDGDLDAAAEELIRAYMGAAEDVFEGQDPKYLAFLRTRAEGI